MDFLCIQIRDELPELKAIVQYKGELSQEYPNVYTVCNVYTCSCSVILHNIQHALVRLLWVWAVNVA